MAISRGWVITTSGDAGAWVEVREVTTDGVCDQVALSISRGDQVLSIRLDHEAWKELCGLRYSVDVVESRAASSLPVSSLEDV